jgi:hypothetical protein
VIRDPRAVAAGVRAALASRRWIDGPRLSELLREPPAARPGARVPRGAVGAALLLLKALARLPRSPWRNTCLYRSVAECLLLRRYGVPAILKIGVRNGQEDDIEAHAWVVRGDRPAGTADQGHEPLVLRG